MRSRLLGLADVADLAADICVTLAMVHYLSREGCVVLPNATECNNPANELLLPEITALWPTNATGRSRAKKSSLVAVAPIFIYQSLQ